MNESIDNTNSKYSIFEEVMRKEQKCTHILIPLFETFWIKGGNVFYVVGNWLIIGNII